MKNKRGISPLIATVLLIGFVIAIAAMAMLFFRGQIEKYEEKAAAQCTPSDTAATKFSLKSCTDQNNKDTVLIELSSEAQKRIEGFRVRLFAGTTAISVTQPEEYDPGESRPFEVKKQGTVSKQKIDKIQIMPFVVKDNKLNVCEENLLESKCE